MFCSLPALASNVRNLRALKRPRSGGCCSGAFGAVIRNSDAASTGLFEYVIDVLTIFHNIRNLETGALR